MRAHVTLVGLLSGICQLAVVACGSSKPEPTAGTPSSPTSAEAAPVVPLPTPPAPAPTAPARLERIGNVVVESVPLPARFTADLPWREADLEALDGFAPTTEITFGLDVGDEQTRARVLAALQRAAASGPVPRRVTGFYAGLMRYGEVSLCTWLASLVTDPARRAAHEAAWLAIPSCDDPKLVPLLTRDDAPDQAIVDWISGRGGFELPAPLPFSARIARAAMAVAKQTERAQGLRPIGFVFARMRGAESVAALRELQAGLADGERRAVAGLGMLSHDTAEGRALGAESCKHAKLSDDPMCESITSGPYVSPKPPEGDAAKLSACARGADQAWDRATCLRALVAVDRKAAVALARELEGAAGRDDGSLLPDYVKWLLAFPEAGALERRLDELGLSALAPRPPEVAGEPPLTLFDHLGARGRMHRFDTETDQFPNEHDRLLLQLAALTGNLSLSQVHFEELAPPESHMEDGPYTLRAYMDGKRYTIAARNYGDWYDVAAVLELLNTLEQARGSDVRVMLSPTRDQTAIAVAGPQKGLDALAAAGLLEIERASDAGMQNGKGFEQRVIEELKKGE